jgi:uncharacterized protein GlcG (DUF336 family)
MRSKLSLSISDADTLLRAAAEAAATGQPVSIAVVDESGALLAFRRMDGARAYTVDLATQKARTSAMVGVPTAMVQAAGGRDVTAGGLPVVSQTECVGAVGISGSKVEDDVRIASAAIAALIPRREPGQA